MYVLCRGCYEEGSTDSMAEEGSVNEGLENQFQSLLSRYTGDESRADSKSFCSDFCKVVEEHASRWQVPLPQLRILEKALCYFTRASTVFTPSCDHVLHTLSSLALSIFELLLFFDQKDFHQETLKNFTVTFQECHLALARHQNVYLLQVEQSVRGGGPWACPALQAILSRSSLPQSEVDGCISSELPVFFELRIRYLLSCERVGEAMALAKCCAWHPTAGQHLFFLQVYLTWLLKTSQHDCLHKEVAKLNGKDAVHIICSLECEEKDELLLALSRAFLSQQLCRGDMYYLCDLVFLWSKLHHRLKTPKTDLLKEIHQLMLSATNVNSIFPFIRAILQEVGEDGIQFCVELCANALESCLPCDVITKSLIYKTIAGLLPNDLEVCRACALLVFFLERTVEAYKTVYLLYMHPDQEYHVEYSPIRNHVRFETLQVLKKDLYFDPELWNLIALRTNCLKLMTEKGVGTALEEIMEDKWISNYCTKELSLRSSMSGCQKEHKGTFQGAAKKRHQREDRHDRGVSDAVSKRLRVGPGRTRLSVDHTVKKRGNHGSRPLKDASSEPLRRSFWQLDRLQDIWGHGEHRRITRLSEKNPPKRRIRTPKWLLEDSGTLAENNVPMKNKKHKLKLQKHRLSSVEKKSETSQIKNSVKHKPSVNSDSMTNENHSKHAKEYSLDCDQPASPPQVILELSLPDNELMGTFNEDTCNRQRGFPQVLLYKPTVKLPATSQPVKAVHGKEVILRARDASMFVQQLHCYARRLKGKGNGLNIQSSVSTITRSSVQGSPLKGSQKKLSDKSQMPVEATEPPVLENILQAKTVKAGLQKASTAREQPEKPATSQSMEAANAMEPPILDKFPPDISTEKVVENNTGEHTVRSAVIASQTSAEPDVTEAPVLEKVQQVQPREHCEESTVEMKVTIASKSPPTGKVSQSPALDKVSKSEVLEFSTGDSSQMVLNEEIPPVSRDISDTAAAESLASQSFHAHGDDKQLGANALPSHDGVSSPKVSQNISEVVISPKPTKRQVSSKNDASLQKTTVTTTSPVSDRLNDISALTLVTEMVTELAPETQTHKLPAPEDCVPKDKQQVPHKTQTTSSCSVHEPRTSAVSDDSDPEISENGEPIETEESRLEYCCTFCNKVFKGSRVVAHAMFHYRKDECMFCGTIFRDDLLAMMHLSDHIEKLKKSKDTPRNKTEKRLSEAKVSTPKTSAKAKSNNLSSGHRSRGRPRKSDVSSKSVSLPGSTSLASRKLRSDHKPLVGPSLREKKQNASGHLNSPTSGHKLNGHFGKKKELERLTVDTLTSEAKQPYKEQGASRKRTSNVAKSESQEEYSASSLQVDQKSSSATKNKTETLHIPKKDDRKIVEGKLVEPQEKLCCPVDGCTWFTDLSKNRVRLLYHALDDHHGEVGPLKLAFRIGNNKCSICMRVLWSFDHFLHHVERHRLSPRHPCLHQGCTARFKTGIEMRRHTRKHSPLQAACCLPGCSQLFICLWALNLHEREHYASKPIKPDEDTNKEACDKDDLPSRKKLLNHKPNDKTATTTVNKPISRKGAHKPRGQAPQDSSAEMHAEAVSPTNARVTLLNWKTTGSQVLKNPSCKNTSAQMTGPMQRLRQRLRKIQGTKQNLVPLKSHKVVLSSHNVKVQHRFVNRQMQVNPNLPKKRGRPPKSKKGVCNEKPAGQHNKTVKATSQPKGLKKAAEVSNVIKKLKEKLKRISQNTRTHVVTASTAEDCKGTADKTQEAPTVKAKKRPPAEEDGGPTESEEPKKQKIVDEKAEKEPELSKTNLVEVEAQPTASEERGKDLEREAGNTELPQELVTVPENSSDEPTLPPSTPAENTEKNAEKKLHSTNRERKGEKKSRPASDKKSKKPKNATKTGEPVKRGRPRKDASKTSSKKVAKSSSDVKWVEAKAGESASAVETTKASLDSAASALTAPTGGSLNELTALSTTPKENGQKKAKKEKIKKSLPTKNTDSDQVSKKRKDAKEADTKTAKKKMKVQGLPTVTEEPESSIKGVLPPATLKGEETQSSVDGEQKTSAETAQSDAGSRGHSLIVNGETKAEDVKNKVCMETLAEYSKKPYLRPPPTVYLDERYTTMPKRRKEISFFLPSHSRQDQDKSSVALQRQRCANCFTTFNSAEELQRHLQLQKCSNLFGFDSDDEATIF